MFWGISQFRSIWMPRYMFPSLLGWTLLGGILYRATVTPLLRGLAAASPATNGRRRLLPGVVLTLALVVPFSLFAVAKTWRDLRTESWNHRLWTATAGANLPAALAEANIIASDYDLVVTRDINLFCLLLYQNPDVDLTLAVEDRHLANWHDFWPQGHYVGIDELVNRKRPFLMLDENSPYDWASRNPDEPWNQFVQEQSLRARIVGASPNGVLHMVAYTGSETDAP